MNGLEDKEFLEIQQSLSDMINTANLEGNIEDAVTDYGAKCERQGFINGFKIAVRIMIECLGKQNE